MKIIFSIALLLCVFTVQSQKFDLKHDHTNILVSNLEVSAKFYSDILQLTELDTPWGINPNVKFFAIGNGQQIHLARVPEDSIKNNKITHLAFNVIEFDLYLEFLINQNIGYSDFSGNISGIQVRPDGVRQIYLQDPDGNWIEINEAKY